MSTVRTFTEQEQFAAERFKFYGGSDTPNFFNIEPYYCERRLAYFKMPGEDGKPMFSPDFIFYGNKATKRGEMMERFAAEMYSEETGRDIRKGTPRQDKVLPFLRPQPDFDILNNARGKELGAGTLSIKVPGREMFLRLKQAIRDLADKAPKSEWAQKQAEMGKQALLPYELQLQSEIGSQGRLWGSFGLMWADQLEIVYADHDYDADVYENMIRPKAKDHWERLQKRNIDLFPRLDANSKQCSKCEFRVTCQSENLMKLLQSEDKMGKPASIPVLPILDQLRTELRERAQLVEEAEMLLDETKDSIRDALRQAGCDVAEAETMRVYNRLQKGRESLQKAPMLKYLREKAEFAKGAKMQIENGQILVPPDVAELVDLWVELPDIISDKFVSTGAPFAVLKTFDINKNLTKGNGSVQ